MDEKAAATLAVRNPSFKEEFNMKYLEEELGIEALRTMKRIKVALDPNNIMNPRKLIPPHITSYKS
ncbi:hypothetical protein RJ640_027089 [Escallonia rubra]|uniref:FAD-binding oxidoreductase/transferase type 4 C-terminal domain-containing protein n=1 Tax=Escallonia rubra TaxID=112253 RepID=A0AA88QNM7_9ASTE|nr:hypothetical protein RJ640_027089 [Escallonia rubra]